jgi:inosose dehydratase
MKKWKVACFTAVVPDGDLEDQMAEIRKMGFNYCDLADTCDGASLHAAYAPSYTVNLDGNPFDVKRLADKYNLEIVDVCAHADLIGPPASYRYGSMQIIKAIKFAADIGIPYVITSEGTHLEWNLTEEELLHQIKFSLKEPLRYAEDYKVKILLEPHGPLTTSAKGLHKIFDTLGNSEWLGVNFDTGNCYLSGNDPVEVLSSIIDKVEHLHLKEVSKEAPRGIKYLDHNIAKKIPGMWGVLAGGAIGSGVVPFEELAKILEGHGFEGPATLEVSGIDNILKSKEYLERLGVF